MQSTREFFDEMALTYDRDLLAVGWDPLALIRRWPLVLGPGERLLDVGCGTGAVLELFVGADRELAGMDLSPEMLRLARKKRRGLREARLEAASAEGPWPFEDQSFDAIVALAMLEFVPELGDQVLLNPITSSALNLGHPSSADAELNALRESKQLPPLASSADEALPPSFAHTPAAALPRTEPPMLRSDSALPAAAAAAASAAAFT